MNREAPPGDLVITLRGETLHLLPERAIYWPREAALIAADVHLGKAATFRARGIPLPEGSAQADLDRLSGLIERTDARRVILLGDVIHAVEGGDTATAQMAQAWRARHEGIAVDLVPGNHDRGSLPTLSAWGFTIVGAREVIAPFAFVHRLDEAAAPSAADPYPLAGHVHPAIDLRGRGGQRMKVSCFWFRRVGGILPAFGTFTGGAVVRPVPDDRVYITSGARVLAI